MATDIQKDINPLKDQVSGELYEQGIILINNNNFWKERKMPLYSLMMCASLCRKIGADVIVEIGTGLQGAMSGNSIKIWTNETHASHIYAVDLDKKQLDSLKELAERFSNLILVHKDAFDFVENLDKKIDLLYLDYWVPEDDEEFFGNARAQSYAMLYEQVRVKMNDVSLILIDDTDHLAPWKQTLIIPQANKDGFNVLYTGRQTLLYRGIEC